MRSSVVLWITCSLALPTPAEHFLRILSHAITVPDSIAHSRQEYKQVKQVQKAVTHSEQEHVHIHTILLTAQIHDISTSGSVT